MDHLPISPFGQPIYKEPLSGQHTVHLDHILQALALTLEDDSYKGADSKLDPDQVGGLIDVMLYLDAKLSDPNFHAGVTRLCQEYEGYKTNPESIHGLQEALRSLGDKRVSILHNQYIDLIASYLTHIREALHEA